MRLLVLFIACLLGITCVTVKPHRFVNNQPPAYYDSILSADSFKYWDFSSRGGWLFIKGHKMIEYNYNFRGARIREDYHDVMVDTLRWRISNDTFIYFYNDFCKQVLFLSKDSVVFKGIQPDYYAGYVSKLIPAEDQKTPFKKEPLHDPDTSKWPIHIHWKD